MNRVVALIPAYNEQEAIGEVVSDVKKYLPDADVVVINDGSSDLTAEQAKKFGAFVLDLPYNLGIGGAVQTGYRFAEEMGYELAIRLDGDGQHNPVEASKLLGPIENGQADVVTGSRYAKAGNGYRSSFIRFLGIKLFGAITSCIVHRKISDVTSGFQAVNRRVIEFYSHDYPSDYPEIETIPLLHWAGFHALEVPVSMKERQTGNTSITPIRSVYYVMKVTLALFMGLLRKKISLVAGSKKYV